MKAAVSGLVGADREIARHLEAEARQPLGLICPHIVVPESVLRLDDPVPLVEAVERFNLAAQKAQYWPGEYPAEAICTSCVSGYVSSVHLGGHQSWAEDHGYDPFIIQMTGIGLKAIGADAWFDIWSEYDQHLNHIITIPNLYDLDRRLHSLSSDVLGSAIAPFQAKWLGGLACLKPVPDAELHAALAALAAAHPQREARLRVKAWSYPDIPRMYEAREEAMERLCHGAGLRLEKLVRKDAVTVEGERCFAWVIATNKGPRWMVFRRDHGPVTGYRAELRSPESGGARQGSPIYGYRISQDQYEANVPDNFQTA